MRKYLGVFALVGAALLTLAACSSTPVTDPAINVSQSYGQASTEYEPAEVKNELDKVYTDDYCSFAYDSKNMSISDLSDSSVTGSYLSIEPMGGMPEGSITHLEVFGGEKLTIPQDYTEESWKEYAKELTASFYDDASDLKMAVPAAEYHTENGLRMSATVSVEAVDDVPAMTAEILAVNGENQSLVMIATTYANDPVDVQPYLDVMNSAKVQ